MAIKITIDTYVTLDDFIISQGDNFFMLIVSDIQNGKMIYCIKYWNCKFMKNYSKNREYLSSNKLRFFDKKELQKYILENNLDVINYKYHFLT